MERKRFQIIAVVLGIFFLLTGMTSLYAQVTKDEEGFTLEEITVTAQKRQENQQKVAIGMDVLTGEDLRELGKSNVQDILQDVSNIIINKSSDGYRIAIRSIADDKPEFQGIATSTPTVALNTDGVFSNRKASGRDLYDIERVEVLYGPQSTLYASTSFGGIVNVVTAAPKLDKYEASGTIEYGNYEMLRMEGAVNAPLSESFGLRAAFSATRHDGYLTNGADDEEVRSARLRALYEPNDRISFLITGELERTGGAGSSSAEQFINQDDPENPWTASSKEAQPERVQTNKKVYATLTVNFDFGTFTLVPAYTKRDYSSRSSRTNPLGVMVTTDTTDNGYEKGVEARLSSNEDSFMKWIVGLNWYDSLYESSGVSDDGGWSINSNRAKIKAAYGNLTYPVTDAFRVTGGLRYSDDVNDSYLLQWPDMFTGGLREEATYVSNSSPDYKIGVEYDLRESSMAYADVSTSYRTQKGRTAAGVPFPPEYLTAYTLGSKNRFLNNRLQLNLAAYYYYYENFMVTGNPFDTTYDLKELDGIPGYTGTNLYDPDTGTYRNEAASSRDLDINTTYGDLIVWGLDVQGSAVLTSQDKLDVNLSYSKSEWEKLFFDYADFYNDLGIPDEDYAGRGKPYDPHLTINAAYTHNFDLPNGGLLSTRLDVRYQSEYSLQWNKTGVEFSQDGWFVPTVVDNSGYVDQEAYHTENISATYTHSDGKWYLTAYVNNITDYAVKLSYGFGGMHLGPPRTYGAVFSLKL